MKTMLRILSMVVFSAVSVSARPVRVTLEQCRSAISQMSGIRTDADANRLFAAMTSGDEMQLSTRFESCIAQHSDTLNAAEIARLNVRTYKLDADIISRMWGFIEKRHLADAFNDEQEANKAK
jgi:hypothetical protein